MQADSHSIALTPISISKFTAFLSSDFHYTWPIQLLRNCAVFSLLLRSKRTQKHPNRPTPCSDIKITTNYAISSALCDYPTSQPGIKSIKHLSSSPQSSYYYPTISDHFWPLFRYLTSFTKICYHWSRGCNFHQNQLLHSPPLFLDFARSYFLHTPTSPTTECS